MLVIKRRVKGKVYAVLPGGSVEPGETFEETAVRELWEETTLSAGTDRLLWIGDHNGREAQYFLMTDVEGLPSCPVRSWMPTALTTASNFCGQRLRSLMGSACTPRI